MDLEDLGGRFFQYLFRTRPEVYKKFFPSYNVSDDAKLAAHGCLFMADVGVMVECAGNEKKQGELVSKMKQITRSHAKRGIRTPTYRVITLLPQLSYLLYFHFFRRSPMKLFWSF